MRLKVACLERRIHVRRAGVPPGVTTVVGRCYRPAPTPASQQRSSRCRPPNSPTTRPRRPQPQRLAPARMIRTVRCLLALIRSRSAVPPFRSSHALGTERPPPHSASSILQPTSARGAQRNRCLPRATLRIPFNRISLVDLQYCQIASLRSRSANPFRYDWAR